MHHLESLLFARALEAVPEDAVVKAILPDDRVVDVGAVDAEKGTVGGMDMRGLRDWLGTDLRQALNRVFVDDGENEPVGLSALMARAAGTPLKLRQTLRNTGRTRLPRFLLRLWLAHRQGYRDPPNVPGGGMPRAFARIEKYDPAFPDGRIFDIDHIVAVADGGTNDVKNLQALDLATHREKTFKEARARRFKGRRRAAAPAPKPIIIIRRLPWRLRSCVAK